MNPRLQFVIAQRTDEMRISVPSQEHALKEQHANRPDSGASTKPGQDKAAHHGLHLEQQESAQEDRGGK